jgi:hypothetical protein
LRREIESLLAADAQASIGGFLEVPAAAKFAGMFASNQSAKAMSEKPMILNERYKIERELGRGQGKSIKKLLTATRYADKCAFIGHQRGVRADGRIDYKTFFHTERPSNRAAQEAQLSGYYRTGHWCGIERSGRVGSD